MTWISIKSVGSTLFSGYHVKFISHNTHALIIISLFKGLRCCYTSSIARSDLLQAHYSTYIYLFVSLFHSFTTTSPLYYIYNIISVCRHFFKITSEAPKIRRKLCRCKNHHFCGSCIGKRLIFFFTYFLLIAGAAHFHICISLLYMLQHSACNRVTHTYMRIF